MQWDYLIVTASNQRQATAYESQLRARREAGLLPRVRETLVVPDLDGRRIGSGGSTLECLRVVIEREPGTAAEILGRRRVLIIHAGGDSRRLPAYGTCGKIFVPVPGHNPGPLPLTLFDRLLAPFLDLPAQIVVAAGDALLPFDPAAIRAPEPGLTMLGSSATPDAASRHGVFCAGAAGTVRLYLQKPSPAEQVAMGALDGAGRALLDLGVTLLDASAAAALLAAFEVDREWSPGMRGSLLTLGIDLYREICCAMGAEATLDHYIRTVRAAGSKWSDAALARLFPKLRAIPFLLQVLPEHRFLHFGSTGQLISSGFELLALDGGRPPAANCLSLNNRITAEGRIEGANAWVEGCRIAAPLRVAGPNVVIGADIMQPLDLPPNAALDIMEGTGRTWFVRCYSVGDSFKDANFLGRRLPAWLDAEVWSANLPPAERTLWNARLFPVESTPEGYRRWLWMYDPAGATAAQQRQWREARRVTSAQIALLADQGAFHRRRAEFQC